MTETITNGGVSSGFDCTYRYGGVDVDPQQCPDWMSELMQVHMPIGLEAKLRKQREDEAARKIQAWARESLRRIKNARTKANLAMIAEAAALAELAREPSIRVSPVSLRLKNSGVSLRQLLMFYHEKGITKNMKTNEVVLDIIIPETSEQQTCYMDSQFMEEHGGPLPASELVSHWWGSSFLNTVVNILLHTTCINRCKLWKRYWRNDNIDVQKVLIDLSEEQLARTFFLCIFAINHHANETEFDKMFEVLQLTEGLVVSLDPGLETLRRVWVLAEIGDAMQANIPIYFKRSYDFHEEVTRTLEAFESVVPPVSRCNSTNPRDKDMILKRIDEGLGQDNFNRCVSSLAELSFGFLHQLGHGTGNLENMLCCVRQLVIDATWAQHICNLNDMGSWSNLGKLGQLHEFTLHLPQIGRRTNLEGLASGIAQLHVLQRLTLDLRCTGVTLVDSFGLALEQLQGLRDFMLTLWASKLFGTEALASGISKLHVLERLKLDLSCNGAMSVDNLGESIHQLHSLRDLSLNLRATKITSIDTIASMISDRHSQRDIKFDLCGTPDMEGLVCSFGQFTNSEKLANFEQLDLNPNGRALANSNLEKSKAQVHASSTLATSSQTSHCLSERDTGPRRASGSRRESGPKRVGFGGTFSPKPPGRAITKASERRATGVN